jgi:hypothetical protein
VPGSVNQVLTATQIAGYAGAGLAGAAYVPQISHLIRARCSAGVSRLAFGVWLLASCLVMARAVALHAGVFIVLGVIQITATAIIVFYATRYRDAYCPGHQLAAPGPGPSPGRPAEMSPRQAGQAPRGLAERTPAGRPAWPATGAGAAPGAGPGSVPARPAMTDQGLLSRTVPGTCPVGLRPLTVMGRRDLARWFIAAGRTGKDGYGCGRSR